MKPWHILPLSKGHDRKHFVCGQSNLDAYLQKQALQDIKRRVATCFVLLDNAECIAGYYTLSAGSVLLDALPEALSKKLPRYPTVPVVRMGRLAVATSAQGQGLGGVLLYDALARTLRAEIAAYALLVDAKDTSAAAFYAHHGFIALPERSLTLFLPLASVRAFQL